MFFVCLFVCLFVRLFVVVAVVLGGKRSFEPFVGFDIWFRNFVIQSFTHSLCDPLQLPQRIEREPEQDGTRFRFFINQAPYPLG